MNDVTRLKMSHQLLDAILFVLYQTTVVISAKFYVGKEDIFAKIILQFSY